MRDYSKVSSSFWTGKTGKALRGNQQAQIVALYLMTCPHANMIGVFHCPIIYIAHETGSSIEGASEGLKALCEGAFCTYDEDSETVWVHEMARFQIGEKLSPNDKQVVGIKKQFDNLPEGHIKQGFHARYSIDFSLPDLPLTPKPLASPLQAPSKPEAVAGTGTEAGTGASTGTNIVPLTSSLSDFERFYAAYPKKRSPEAALKAWNKKRPPIDSVLEALAWQVESKGWVKDKGQYIPYPATYINDGGWRDEKPAEEDFSDWLNPERDITDEVKNG